MTPLQEVLIEIRNTPRKLREDYLKPRGLIEQINQIIPSDNYKTKEKIDIIIKGEYNKCYCGEFAKTTSKWCSISCMNRDVERNSIIGRKNSENKIERSIKLKSTLQIKYGVSSVQSIPSVKQKTKLKKQVYYNSVINNTFDKYGVDIDKYSDCVYLESVCKNKSLHTISKELFNGMPITTIDRHFRRIGFEGKFQPSCSAGERDMGNFIKSLGVDIVTNDRKIIKPKELDIVIPEKRLAIEFNGLYWHANDKTRHRDKKELCHSAGYTLLQFFEDEWYNKRPICESMIKNKLGMSRKVFARKTEVRRIEGKIARKFMDDSHIQGFVAGEHYGLEYDGELVCLMTVGKSRFFKGSLELLRYSNTLNTTVVGGFSKLLKYVKKLKSEETIYSYADLRFSDGNVYDKFGKFVRTTSPGYFWVNTSTICRLSRYSCMKHKLHKLLGSKFDSSQSEVQNMENAGYSRIYDCGHNLYAL